MAARKKGTSKKRKPPPIPPKFDALSDRTPEEMGLEVEKPPQSLWGLAVAWMLREFP